MKLRIAFAILLALALAVPVPASASEPRVDHVRVPSHDGIVLDGWVVRPPGEVRRPVVLWSSPYFGQCGAGASLFAPGAGAGCFPRGDDPAVWDASHPGEAVPVGRLLERGYAVAMFNVRGTGGSGGCFEYFGEREQLDQAHLVQWLAGRPWSNRRVGMMGLSYHGTTPLEAAIHQPRHLRAIVVGGIVSDPYGFTFSPQGAAQGAAMYDLQAENFATSYSLAPPAGGGPTAARLCPEVAEFATHAKRGGFTADRDPEFWAERRLVDRFDRIRAAVLIAHGLQDLWGSGHKFAEDDVWSRIRAPKRMLLGQWGHEFPDHNSIGHPEWVMDDWHERALGWLDRWLGPRRRGRAPRDRVEYQDSAGSWHRARRWPPKASVEATMPLVGEFRSQPRLDALFRTEHLLCLDEGTPPPGGRSAVVEYTDPLRQDLLVAGNPSAELRLSSDEPGGQVSVNLFDVPPGATCDAGSSDPRPRRLTLGAADLRFHHGGARPRAFPVATPQGVHVDLANLAAVVPAGHRLAAVASFGEPSEYETFPHMSTRITLHPGSRVVLPLLPPHRAGGARG